MTAWNCPARHPSGAPLVTAIRPLGQRSLTSLPCTAL